MKNIAFGLFVILSMAIFAGCSNEDEGGAAEVVNIFFEDDTIRVGEGTVVNVDFTYDSGDIFDDDNNVVVVVRLPEELSYREGTTEIDGLGGDDEIGAQVTNCIETGETFLVYDMDRFDLDDAANPDGDADARLKFTVDGVSPATVVIVEARANDTLPVFACGEEFFSDDQDALSVL